MVVFPSTKVIFTNWQIVVILPIILSSVAGKSYSNEGHVLENLNVISKALGPQRSLHSIIINKNIWNAPRLYRTKPEKLHLKPINTFLGLRLKRDAPTSNSTFISKVTTFMTENIECNTVIGRICPGTGIGCTFCQYFSRGTCSNICSVTDIICNAAIMRCLGEKTDE